MAQSSSTKKTKPPLAKTKLAAKPVAARKSAKVTVTAKTASKSVKKAIPVKAIKTKAKTEGKSASTSEALQTQKGLRSTEIKPAEKLQPSSDKKLKMASNKDGKSLQSNQNLNSVQPVLKSKTNSKTNDVQSTPALAANSPTEKLASVPVEALVNGEAQLATKPLSEKAKAKERKAREKAFLKDALAAQQPGTAEELEARRNKLKNLIKLGKERGFLTYAEINDHLPEDVV